MSTRPDVTFDEWLRDELDRRGWRQEDLAELIGVDQSTVSGWTTGNARPQPPNCDSIARLFGLPRNEVRRRAGRKVVPGELSARTSSDLPPVRKPSDPRFQQWASIGLRLTDDQIDRALELLEAANDEPVE